MKRSLILLSKLMLIFYNGHVLAQETQAKPPITLEDISRWPAAPDAWLSGDGRFMAISQPGHRHSDTGRILIQSTDLKWKREFENVPVTIPRFTSDSRYAVTKLNNDLQVLDLLTKKEQWLPGISTFSLTGKESSERLVYQLSDANRTLVLRNLNKADSVLFSGVDDYRVNDQGTAFLFVRNCRNGNQVNQKISWWNIGEGAEKDIWSGTGAWGLKFSPTGNELIFFVDQGTGGNSIWHFKEGMTTALCRITKDSPGVDAGFTIAKQDGIFSADGKRLFIRLSGEKPEAPSPERAQVDVWNYKDFRPQTEQMVFENHRKAQYYAAVVDLAASKIMRLESDGEKFMLKNDYFGLAWKKNFDFDGTYRHPVDSANAMYLVSALTGERKLVRHISSAPNSLFGSPTGRWVFYDDADFQGYCYDVATGETRCVTKAIDMADKSSPRPSSTLRFLAGWTENDNRFLLFDAFGDLWCIDPSGKTAALNITNGYGRTHHIYFRISYVEGAEGYFDEEEGKGFVPGDATLILSGFSRDTKEEWIFRKTIGKPGDPEKLTGGNWCMYPYTDLDASDLAYPVEAKKAAVWMIKKQSAVSAPNYFLTKDWKTFKQLTDFQPQQKFNWLTTVLINYEVPGFSNASAILYKPENLDSTKKYPVIFSYYEELSNGINFFHRTDYTSGADIDIPFYVSNGYIVCVPDIRYKIGEPGESALKHVLAAAGYLKKIKWVDADHMGICGHSFGGFETNFIVTHSTQFAAASEGAGPSDFVSGYLGNYGNSPAQWMYEKGQPRIDATLWDRPDLYISNSPVFNLLKVQTPLLIMHNQKDFFVPFAQGMELYSGLKRLGKPVWMLQYDKGGHGIKGDIDAKDYTIREYQFFNHYLKGDPPPRWMTKGIPARLKGIEQGYEFDPSGNCGPGCRICLDKNYKQF